MIAAVANAAKVKALFCSPYKRKGAARPKRRQGFPVILVLDRKPAFWGVAELADAPDCFSGGESATSAPWRFESFPSSHFINKAPIYYVGDLILHAVLSMLCGALFYMWFLKTWVLPPGTSFVDVQNNFNYEMYDMKPSPP